MRVSASINSLDMQESNNKIEAVEDNKIEVDEQATTHQEQRSLTTNSNSCYNAEGR